MPNWFFFKLVMPGQDSGENHASLGWGDQGEPDSNTICTGCWKVRNWKEFEGKGVHSTQTLRLYE